MFGSLACPLCSYQAVFFQMALSAASPFYRGYVSDIDCRWGVISASVDDRTREERGLEVSDLSSRCPLFFLLCVGFFFFPGKNFLTSFIIKFCLWSSESLMRECGSRCGKCTRDGANSHLGCTAYVSKYVFS